MLVFTNRVASPWLKLDLTLLHTIVSLFKVVIALVVVAVVFITIAYRYCCY